MTTREELSHLDISKLLKRSGNRRAVSGELALDGIATSEVHADGLHYDLEMEAVGAEVVIEGKVSAQWTGQCRRCLDSVAGQSEIALREVFEANPTEGETYPISDTEIDLAATLEEAVLLSLPLAPLCGAACGGPAPDRFPTGSEPVDDEAPTPDPRWAVLDDLNFD